MGDRQHQESNPHLPLKEDGIPLCLKSLWPWNPAESVARNGTHLHAPDTEALHQGASEAQMSQKLMKIDS